LEKRKKQALSKMKSKNTSGMLKMKNFNVLMKKEVDVASILMNFSDVLFRLKSSF
jgi:hypothetical protein